MVQIIQGHARKPSIGQRLSSGFNKFAELMGEQEKIRTQQENTRKENAVLKQLTGLDFEGIQDPATREKAFSLAMQAQNQKALQEQKLEGKRDLQREKQDQIAALLGGNKGQNNPQNAFAEQIMGQGSQVGQQEYQNQMGNQQGGGLDVAGMSPEDILKATMIDPNIGKALQHSQDLEFRKGSEEGKAKSKKEARYFAINEPELKQIAETERKLNLENARYSRLGELFQ